MKALFGEVLDKKMETMIAPMVETMNDLKSTVGQTMSEMVKLTARSGTSVPEQLHVIMREHQVRHDRVFARLDVEFHDDAGGVALPGDADERRAHAVDDLRQINHGNRHGRVQLIVLEAARLHATPHGARSRGNVIPCIGLCCAGRVKGHAAVERTRGGVNYKHGGARGTVALLQALQPQRVVWIRLNEDRAHSAFPLVAKMLVKDLDKTGARVILRLEELARLDANVRTDVEECVMTAMTGHESGGGGGRRRRHAVGEEVARRVGNGRVTCSDR